MNKYLGGLLVLVMLAASFVTVSADGGYFSLRTGDAPASKTVIAATQYKFLAVASTLTASFNTNDTKNGLPIILTATGRVRLRVWDNTALEYRYGAWTGYFGNSGNIGSASIITDLVSGRTYDAEYKVDPQDATNYDPSAWITLISFDLAAGDAVDVEQP